MQLAPSSPREWIAAALRIVALITIPATVALLLVLWWCNMPGRSYRGALPPLTSEQAAYRDELSGHVQELAGSIGPRNDLHPGSLDAAAVYIEKELRRAGYTPEEQRYRVGDAEYVNIVATLPGQARADEIVVVGAHYDTVANTPGADDNASGVAAMLALARSLRTTSPDRTVRFVAFANEEPPFFHRQGMGSLEYATRCRQAGDRVTAMVSLECLGYFRDDPGSQEYQDPLQYLYPSEGNYLAFIGNTASRGQVVDAVGAFRRATLFPSEGLGAPNWVGVDLSDHWSFWQQGYPALMITDTAVRRNPNYHESSDTPESLDYDRMALGLTGLKAAVSRLASP